MITKNAIIAGDVFSHLDDQDQAAARSRSMYSGSSLKLVGKRIFETVEQWQRMLLFLKSLDNEG